MKIYLTSKMFYFQIFEHKKGEEKVAVWNRKKNEIEIRKTVHSPIREKIELFRGRLRRQRLNKYNLEDRFNKTLMRHQWEGYQANFVMHPTKYAEMSKDYGARFASAYMLRKIFLQLSLVRTMWTQKKPKNYFGP